MPVPNKGGAIPTTHLLDIDELLTPVSIAAPCGDNLEYDVQFQELETIARGQEEIFVGNQVVQKAIAPDWHQVRKAADALLARTRDVRVAIHLANALVHTEGIVGLADATTLLLGLLEKYWDHVHPQLDEQNDGDPTERINWLSALCDSKGLLGAVREARLVNLPKLGPISYRQIVLAKGEVAATDKGGEAPLTVAQIEAAFGDCDLEEVRRAHSAVASAARDLENLEKLITAKVGAESSTSFEPLRKIVKDIESTLSAQLQRREGAAGAVTKGDGAGGRRDVSLAGAGLSGIKTRDDVIRLLDLACSYYKQFEPSSPVPLFLERAKKLVSMDFMSIVQDIAPGGLPEVKAIRGPKNDGQAAAD